MIVQYEVIFEADLLLFADDFQPFSVIPATKHFLIGLHVTLFIIEFFVLFAHKLMRFSSVSFENTYRIISAA